MKRVSARAIIIENKLSKEEIFEREPARLLLESGAVKNAVYIEYPGAKPEIVCVPKAHDGLVEQRC